MFYDRRYYIIILNYQFLSFYNYVYMNKTIRLKNVYLFSGANTVMSDQLCGYWYLRMTERPPPEQPFDPSKTSRALQTVFDNNVMGFRGGEMGAVNGFRIDLGKKDSCTIQSEEIWTGVSYGLASLMVAEGMVEQGFKTAEGIYRRVEKWSENNRWYCLMSC
jgi:uncharacterized protein (DUF608 family)